MPNTMDFEGMNMPVEGTDTMQSIDTAEVTEADFAAVMAQINAEIDAVVAQTPDLDMAA